MKLYLLIFSLLCLVSTGCDTVKEQLSAPFSPPPPKSHVFAADERTAYAAARKALQELGYGYFRGGPAQGYLEAMSSIQADGTTSLSGGRQIQVQAHFRPAASGGTEMDVVIHELVQSDINQHPGMGTSTLVPDSPVAEELFSLTERGLLNH